MGGAMAKGLIKAGLTDYLTLTAHTQKTLDTFTREWPTLKTSLNNSEAVRGADIVILAVKPWLIDEVMEEITPALGTACVISVAANKEHDRIDVYAMPNIAAEFNQSMTFISNEGKAENIRKAEELFSLLGEAKTVTPRQLQAGMMMAGCGIAYVMRFLRAMTEGGVEMGFYPNDAKEIAMQTMQGAITLLQETGLHPEAAIDKVTTPGGVTIKGLNELDHAGFNSAVIRCLKAGLNK